MFSLVRFALKCFSAAVAGPNDYQRDTTRRNNNDEREDAASTSFDGEATGIYITFFLHRPYVR